MNAQMCASVAALLGTSARSTLGLVGGTALSSVCHQLRVVPVLGPATFSFLGAKHCFVLYVPMRLSLRLLRYIKFVFVQAVSGSAFLVCRVASRARRSPTAAQSPTDESNFAKSHAHLARREGAELRTYRRCRVCAIDDRGVLVGAHAHH